MNLTLALPSATVAPASLQWKMTYPAGSVSGISVTPGAVATAAGKSVSCVPSSGAYSCILWGANTNTLSAGVVAKVNVTAPLTSGSITITLAKTLGASGTGSDVHLSGVAGVLSALAAPVTTALQTLTCNPITLKSGDLGACTVTLANAVTTTTAIGLTSNSAALLTPSSAIVPPGSRSAQFTVLAAGTNSQTAVVTATLNGAAVVASVSITPGFVSALRINAGGPAYTDPSGQVWSADTGYTGGQGIAGTETIRQTPTQPLYQSTRTLGAFSYNLSVPNGLYTVVLKFSERSGTQPGQRVFDVKINGAPALRSFDALAEAGGANTAVDRSIPVAVSKGQIALEFLRGPAGTPMVSAIEVLAGTTATSTSVPQTIRINCGGAALMDVSGISWAADSGYTGGVVTTVAGAITNSATAAIYQSGRAGASTYKFSVPNGQYAVVLKFAELDLAASQTRQFNVSVNGSAVLANFNISQAAGGPMLAVDRAFPATVSNGSLTIALGAGASGTPLLNGMEIIPLVP